MDMNKKTKQMLAASVMLLILVILQSISLPSEGRSLHAWQPMPRLNPVVQDAVAFSIVRDRVAQDLRARPTR